ncbi:MAG: family 10 glycosylhydrolase [Planctomycetes bacterium]|nr:family 10 glycosylhydrolase [Planctomycetota bacterium]
MRTTWILASLLAFSGTFLTARETTASAAHEQVIDRFDYAGAASSRAAWESGKGTPPVTVVRDTGRNVLEFRAPFASVPELPRTILDRDVTLDLATAGQFLLEVWTDQPSAGARVTLYFRSGRGWYGCGASLSEEGWHTLRFPKARFGVEDSPTGWHKVDGIRISVWRGKAVDCRIRLRKLAAVWHDVALLVPSSEDAGSDSRRMVLRTAEEFQSLLSEMGVEADTLDDLAVARGALGRRPLVVIPYAPRIRSEAVRALRAFLDRGGKLFACYTLPVELQGPLGIARLRYYRPEQPGGLAEIRFDARDIAGLPKSVRQASWNINAPEVQGRGARVIGWWYDVRGRSTKRPALVVGPRGAFFSHIVLSDDREGKRQMLAAVLGHLAPTLWPQMAASSIRSIGRIGHLNGVSAVTQFVRASSSRHRAAAALQRGLQTEQRARQLLAGRQYPQAVQTARQARQHLMTAYLQAVPSRPVEGRAFWNHSGTGIYPGDWDRTARELAAAGINMVIPNLLWAGRAHYPSDVLPRSKTFQEYGDQIAQSIAACHKYGIEVHVWKVNHNLSGAPKEFVEQLRREGRLQVGRTGKTHNWLCPSHPKNFELERDSMLEVVRKYDVDGIHFDYIRYPNNDHCYCDGCRKRFEAETGTRVARWPDDCYDGPLHDRYRDWRCQQITRLVAAVSREAKKIRPGIKISAAVFGHYPQCRISVGQDWAAWIKAGYLDFVCPMDYTQSDADFRSLVENQIKIIAGRIPIYPGVGAFRLTPDRMIGQIVIARSLGADGFTIFNLEPNSAASLLSALKAGATRTKATPPHRR